MRGRDPSGSGAHATWMKSIILERICFYVEISVKCYTLELNCQIPHYMLTPISMASLPDRSRRSATLRLFRPIPAAAML